MKSAVVLMLGLILSLGLVYGIPPPVIDVCAEPPEPGNHFAYIPRFFYNMSSGACETFIFGGGANVNGNNFLTKAACESECSADHVCSRPQQTGMCMAFFPSFYYDSVSGTCKSFVYGGCQGNSNRFASRALCEGKCVDCGGEFGVTGMCRAYFPSFSFNAATGRCERFIYGGCGGNRNRFQSQTDCQSLCNASSA